MDHPDLRQFQKLLQTISTCANDCEERNYTLGRDTNTLLDSIRHLHELLVRHCNLVRYHRKIETSILYFTCRI